MTDVCLVQYLTDVVQKMSCGKVATIKILEILNQYLPRAKYNTWENLISIYTHRSAVKTQHINTHNYML